MINLFFTLLCAFLVGYFFLRLKVIGGMMIGSLIGSAVFNIIFGLGYIPPETKYIAQIIAGAFIGCSINKSDLKSLKDVYKPVIFVLLMYLFFNLATGFLIFYLSDLDAPTAFMSAVPGGISDIPIISIDFGANPSIVAAMQFVRLIIGIGLFPSIIKCIGDNSIDNTIDVTTKVDDNESANKLIHNNNLYVVLIFIVSGVGGFLGHISGLSGGVLVFSMLTSLLFKMKFDNIKLPPFGRQLAQLFSGTLIGCVMTINDIIAYKTLIIPIIILVVGYFANCVITGYVLKRKFNFSIREGMLSATPAGAADMALISQDMGITSAKLVVIHVVRLIVVVALFPATIQFVLNLFNL